MRLALVLYCTPVRVFWKRFLISLRVALQKNLDLATSYGLRTSAQSSRSVAIRGALPREWVKTSPQLINRFRTPPKRI